MLIRVDQQYQEQIYHCLTAALQNIFISSQLKQPENQALGHTVNIFPSCCIKMGKWVK